MCGGVLFRQKMFFLMGLAHSLAMVNLFGILISWLMESYV